MHTMDKYKCLECNQQCKEAEDLYTHKKTNHRIPKENKCDRCDVVFTAESELRKHIITKHTLQNQIDCKKCGFKVSSQAELQRHLQIKHLMDKKSECEKCEHVCSEENEGNKHVTPRHVQRESLKCKSCEKEFNTRSMLMHHRKLEHTNTVATCRNYLEEKCDFGTEKCWWIHRDGRQAKIECYFCEKSFDTKNKVMNHRKKEHAKTVKPCQQFLESKCERDDETCWFKHENLCNLYFREVLKTSVNI